MQSDLDLVAMLLSYENKQAVPIASHQKVSLAEDALILCPLSMAGEDCTVWIVAVGRPGQPPKLYSIPDPRQRDAQDRLYDWLYRGINAYFQSCITKKVAPQIIVASNAVVESLDTLAGRLLWRDDNERVKRLGELLSFATQRSVVAGQQVLLSATDVLKEHWILGNHGQDAEHLGAFLTWIEPPEDKSLQEAVEEAREFPAGAKTDPDYDHLVLQPLVTQYNSARRKGADPDKIEALGELIENALAPVVLRIYQQTQKALQTLKDSELPELDQLEALRERDWQSYRRFMDSREKGFPVTSKDSARAAIYRYAERQDAEDNYEATLTVGDELARARAMATGHVLNGQVLSTQIEKIGPRSKRLSFEFSSNQSVLRLRPGTELHWIKDSRLVVRVEDIRFEEGVSHISMVMSKGQRLFGLPEIDSRMYFVPNTPNWNDFRRDCKQFKKRLLKPAWTHSQRDLPKAIVGVSVDDPIRALEELK